jgi:hypothetical protein
MNIDAIHNGIVIDHIRAGQAMKIYDFLDLGSLDCPVAIIKYATSNKMGRKDIIKIDSELKVDLNALGYIDPEDHHQHHPRRRARQKISPRTARADHQHHPLQKPALHHQHRAGAAACVQADRPGKGRVPVRVLREQGGDIGKQDMLI